MPNVEKEEDKQYICMLLLELQIGTNTLENILVLFYKVEYSHDLAIALLGIFPRETLATVNQESCPQIFITVIIIILKNYK